MHVATGVYGRFNTPLTPYIPLSGRGTSPTQSDGRKVSAMIFRTVGPVWQLERTFGDQESTRYVREAERRSRSQSLPRRNSSVLDTSLAIYPAVGYERCDSWDAEDKLFRRHLRLAMFPEASEHS